MPRRVPAMPGTPEQHAPRREQPAPPCLPVRARHLPPQQFCRTGGAARPKALCVGTLARGACSRDGADSLMTEDPRQTRRNGSDPRTAQSRSVRSGGGSSRHVPPRITCTQADAEREYRPLCTLPAIARAERLFMRDLESQGNRHRKHAYRRLLARARGDSGRT